MTLAEYYGTPPEQGTWRDHFYHLKDLWSYEPCFEWLRGEDCLCGATWHEHEATWNSVSGTSTVMWGSRNPEIYMLLTPGIDPNIVADLIDHAWCCERTMEAVAYYQALRA